MDNPYKLLVADIDGTLLDRHGTVSVEDKDALTRASDSGIRISLSTGRVVKTSLRIIDQLELDGYHVFFDGALVADPARDEEVCAWPIDKELVRQAVEFARLNEISLELYSTTQYYIEYETWATDIRRKFFNIHPALVDFATIWPQERIIKATLTASSAEEKAEADSFRARFKDTLNFSWTKTPAYPGIDFINVIAHGASKGRAVEALASFLGIPLTRVAAIGDGANDISLLSTAGLAVAMGNASEELKAVADYVTLDVDNHGVAAAISKFLL